MFCGIYCRGSRNKLTINIEEIIGKHKFGREKGAMPSFEIFSMIDCPKLRMPQSYLNLGSRIRIRLYGFPNLNVKEEHKHMVQQVLLPNPTETKEIIKKI